MSKTPRIISIGLDGTPYSLLKRYVEKGLMPNLAKIIDHGSFHQMNTVLPDVSSVAWTSFMTGKNPGKHGIYGFYDINKQDYSIYFNNYHTLKEPTIWDIINKELNKPSVIINMPSTYPAKPINGILISGFVAVNIEKSVYPKTLLPDLINLNYKMDIDFKIIHKDSTLFFDEINQEIDTKVKLLDLLWEKVDWQLLTCIITGTDRLHHYFMSAYENDSSEFKVKFENYYKKIDDCIAYINSKLIESDLLFIFSDHGFEKLAREINLNVLFKENNLLEETGTELKSLKNITDKTKLFSLDPGRIYIHKYPEFLKAKELSDNDYNVLIKTLKALLKNLKFNGECIVKDILFKQDLYQGKYLNLAPECIIIPDMGYSLKSSLDHIPVQIHTGKHNYHDAFVLTNFPMPLSKKPFILDLSSTILELLNINSSKYELDGNVLLDTRLIFN